MDEEWRRLASDRVALQRSCSTDDNTGSIKTQASDVNLLAVRDFPFAASFEMNPSASMLRQKSPVPVNSAGTRMGLASYFHSALSARLVRLGCSWGLVRSNSINHRQPKSLCIGRPSSESTRHRRWQQVRGRVIRWVCSSRALTSLVHKGRGLSLYGRCCQLSFLIELEMGPRNLAVVSEDGTFSGIARV